jgi:hypothetical protein
MNNYFHNFNKEPGYLIRPEIEFEEYFNSDIPFEKIKFARHYVEPKLIDSYIHCPFSFHLVQKIG